MCEEITIIATFFNNADSVEYCVSSILAQDYERYKVILVDDGSTDETFERINRFSALPNVQVLHKMNGGAADARNYGIKHCDGGLVTFVDGDDVIHPTHLGNLYSAMISSNADIVACRTENVRSSDVLAFCHKVFPKNGQEVVISHQEAVLEILYERLLTSACGRLASKELYDRYPFPAGRYYEDVATGLHYLLSSEQISIAANATYGYVMRNDSITHKRSATMKQVADYLQAIDDLVSCARDECAGLDPAINYFEILELSRVHTLLNSVDDERSAEFDRRVIKAIRKKLAVVLCNPVVSLVDKARFVLVSTLPGIHDALLARYKRKRFDV